MRSGLYGTFLFAALSLFLARRVKGVSLTNECYTALDQVVRDVNYTFWSDRAARHCKVKFQNGVQNCCKSGVVPLLTKRKAVTDSTYSGWYSRFTKPSEFVATWTQIPTPIPTPMPNPQPIPPPTPRPAPPPTPQAPIDDDVIGDVIVEPVTPKPTPFGDIRPPPLPSEIMGLAVPAVPVLFALSGASEGGVDLSGSTSTPPPSPSKTCDMNCQVDCTMRKRDQVCSNYLGKSCSLTTYPLKDFDVEATLDQRAPKEKSMLSALFTLSVTEDFCLPAECDDEDNKLAIMYAFFPGETQMQMIDESGNPLLQCVAAGQEVFYYTILVGVLACACCGLVIFLFRPPPMPIEYKIRRTEDD